MNGEDTKTLGTNPFVMGTLVILGAVEDYASGFRANVSSYQKRGTCRDLVDLWL